MSLEVAKGEIRITSSRLLYMLIIRTEIGKSSNKLENGSSKISYPHLILNVFAFIPKS